MPVTQHQISINIITFFSPFSPSHLKVHKKFRADLLSWVLSSPIYCIIGVTVIITQRVLKARLFSRNVGLASTLFCWFFVLQLHFLPLQLFHSLPVRPVNRNPEGLVQPGMKIRRTRRVLSCYTYFCSKVSASSIISAASIYRTFQKSESISLLNLPTGKQKGAK